ncbi:hypothetical protein RSAG8_11276, partial [Rhizoctonia solani AG-8 WAC10335]
MKLFQCSMLEVVDKRGENGKPLLSRCFLAAVTFAGNMEDATGANPTVQYVRMYALDSYHAKWWYATQPAEAA